MIQTILGSGGAVGKPLAQELVKYTKQIRLASRNPKKVNAEDELVKTDLTKEEDVEKAVENSEVVYLTAGLKYSYKNWKEKWPLIMKNVLCACKKNKARLVFFDNIYMYDENSLNHITEEAPINPLSKKGAIRAEIVNMIFDEIKEGNVKALIARSADFYGPNINNSMLSETVFKNFAKGKKAMWLGNVNYKHSFTYTPDAAKATALLGNTDDAYNQVWHLPTTPNPPTGKEWIEMIAKEMNTEPRYTVVSKFILRIMGLFVPLMGEMVEMFYQNERDYVFESTKFEKKFNFTPKPYSEGIKEIAEKEFKGK